ncbi:peptidyl-prolyl cis-trans isomerase [Clostridium perfringens]|uniref:peptidylprolyl isomerase n=1 Tax=Clostridium perfringens TaxID=1502 RepID=UPI003CFB9E67|nr:peptidyl-prolyl cis-trans isomerase [Clostridium perfringens]
MNKKLFFNIIPITFLIIIIILFFLKANNDYSTIMIINNQKVLKEEYQMIIEKYESKVKSEYSTEDANAKDFWTNNSKGTTPLDKIINLANEELIKNKVLLKIAKDNKLKINVEYDYIKDKIIKENKLKNISFGLSSYTIYNYYKYSYYTLENEVNEYLKKDINISDEELKEIYDKNKSIYTYSVGVKMLIAEYNNKKDNIDLKKLSNKMKTCENIDSLKKEFPNINFYELNMDSIDTKEGKSGVYKLRWDIASQMNPGEINDTLKIGENNIIMKCLERRENTSKTFNEVKGILKSQIQDSNIQNYINQNIKNVVIKYKKSTLEKVALEILNKN